MSARCGFPEDHPLFAGFLPAMRERIVELLAGHDVVLALGAPAFTYHVEGAGPHVPAGAALCQLIDDPSTAAWAPRRHRRRSAASGSALRTCCSARRRAPRARCRRARAGRAPRAEPSSPMSVAFALQTLAEVREPEQHRRRGGAELAAGDARPPADRCAARPSTRWPAAASASACRRPSASRWRKPDARVIALVGDGSAMYSIQALWSAAQLKLPITFVILNNRRYAALQEFAPTFGFAPDAAARRHRPAAASTSSRWRAAWAATRVRVEQPEALRDALAGGAALGRAVAGRDRRRLNADRSREMNGCHSATLRRAVALRSRRLARLAAGACPLRAARRPGRPSRSSVVVNFPPGGAADQIARLVGQPLQEALGQPVVIENKTGAGGNVAGDAVAKSAPDGYTLLMSSGGMVSVNPHIYPKMSFDPAKDLTPVAAAARVLGLPGGQAGVPGEGRRRSSSPTPKANPGKLSYGSPGNGSSPHLAGEMMNSQAGTSRGHIPYRGAAPALQDLLGGQIDFLFDPGIAPAARAGRQAQAARRRRPAALAALSRRADARRVGPEGLRRRHAVRLLRAGGTPKPVIERLNARDQPASSRPSRWRDRIVALGGATVPMTPAQFDAKARDDSQRFGAIIRERKIVGD